MTEITSKSDLYELPNGAVLSFDNTELLKLKTNKDRYGSETGILVLDTESDTKRQIRSVNDGVCLVAENAAFISEQPKPVSEIEYLETDKERLQEWINEYHS